MHLLTAKLSAATLSVAAIIVVAVPVAKAVRNAPLETQEQGTVFAVYNRQAVEPKFHLGGTAFSVKYPRCLVTADHVRKETQQYVVLDSQPAQVVSGDPAMVISTLFRGQLTKQKVSRSVTVGQMRQPWEDIAVLWAENLQSNSTDKHTAVAQYRTGEIKSAAEFGLPSESKSGALLVNPSVRSMLRGYGASGSMLFQVGSGFYADVGFAYKRTGYADAYAYHDGAQNSNNETGAIIRVKVRPEETLVYPGLLGQIACKGDSGGPLMKPGNDRAFYGVLSQSSAVTGSTLTYGYLDDLQLTIPWFCKDVKSNHYSAFNAKNLAATAKAIEETCGKNVTTGTQGSGKVDGSLYPPQDFEDPDNPSLNSEFDCDSDDPEHADCNETIHYGQTMTAVATPDSGWAFDHWTEMTYGCPCHASTNPTCVIPEDTIGWYTDTQSVDHGGCKAVFVPLPPSSAGGTASSRGTSSSASFYSLPSGGGGA